MTDPEIIKLKKQIHNLTEYNVQLKQQVEELTLQIGEYQTRNIDLINQGLFLQTQKELATDEEKIKKQLEQVMEEERIETNKFRKENEILNERIKNYERQIKENEIYIQKLQLNNEKLQRDLIEFGKKHEAQDYIERIKTKELEIMKVNEEREKFTRDYDELCNRMEDVISENRVLRQIADVPENFGIDISKINVGDRIKIEDYKAKIRILQHDIDDLETERAQLKHRIQFLANSLNVSEPPFHLLTQEQKVEVAKYAQNLYEGREDSQPEKYELVARLKEKDNQIRILEEELKSYKSGGGIKYPDSSGSMLRRPNPMSANNDQLETMKKMLSDYKNDIINSLKEKTANNFGDEENNWKTNPKLAISSNNIGGNTLEIFSANQLPPVPIFNNSKMNNANQASSYKFFSRFKIQPDIIHEIFGVSDNREDADSLKRECCALQSQIIELLEIESRRNSNDESLKKNLDSVFNKLEKITLIQNEIFKRYMEKRTNSDNEITNYQTQINNLNDELSNLKRIADAREETINLLKRNNPNELNQKIIEKMKDNAILNGNYIKLNRKYKALYEEEKSLREFLELNEKNNLEKEKQLKETIIKLKQWKAILTKYLKFVNNKLRKSVDKEEYDKINMENKTLREKNRILTLKDIEYTKESTNNQTLILKYKDLENSFYLMQEGKYDAEIEMNYLKHRLQEIDPNYYNEQRAFRKLVQKLSTLNKTYNQIKRDLLSIGKSPSLINDYENRKMNNISDDLSFLTGLTLDNAFISKIEFENCLRNEFNITEEDINKKDLILIFRYLNCDEDNKIDIRNFLKKIEQNSISDMTQEKNDDKILEDFIKLVQKKRQNLLLTFEHFDQNNNGCITREEFKYVLNQLDYQLTDEQITKLIFLVSGDTAVDKDVNIQNLDNTDTFNYIEFCNLFEQKSKNYLLKQKRQYLNKNKMKIDWKTNALTKIYLSLNKNHLLLDEALKHKDKTEKGYLTFNEFELFLNSINAPLESEKKKLFDYFDTEKIGYINIDTFKKAFHQIILQSEEYQKINNDYNDGEENILENEKNIKIKYFKLVEEKKFFEIKLNSFKKRCENLEESNDNFNKEINNYKNKTIENVNKYIKAQNELDNLNQKYAINGVTRLELSETQNENDSLKREVMLLRVSMNTFKDLYNATNMQLRHLDINDKRNLDELDMYKRALKELQGESNQNSLIGKLYYSVLVSRWREAHTLRSYGELINDFGNLKEENFVLEKDNKLLTENLNEINKTLHKETIENIKMMDKIEKLENGILEGNFEPNTQTNPIDELKNLVNMLKEDKKQNTEKIIVLKKKVLSLENVKDNLENKIDFCENLKNNIKFNNRDEFSKKLINLSEELSNARLQNNVLRRENNFEKENSEHLQRINDELNSSIKDYEIQNTEWEKKYTKMEELFRKRDEERQNKIIGALERMKLYDSREVNSILKGKPLYGSKNISNSQKLDRLVNPIQAQEDAVNEERINQLNRIIEMKDQEIQRLMKLNEDNAKFIREGENYLRGSPELFKGGLNEDKKDDEAKLVAKIAHKTIRSIQDMLNDRTRQLNQKNKQIEDLYDQISKLKTEHIQRVNSLEDQIKDAHDVTIGKLNKLIDNTNHNLIAKFTRDELKLMTLEELEKLINDKDNAINGLAIELKSIKEENDTNYIVLKEKNKKIADLEMQLQILKENNNEEYNKNIINRLQKEIDIKSNLLDEEKKKANQIKNYYEQLYKKKLINDEEAKLASTVYVPERLIINKEKSELYVKIEKLRKENRKINDEKKKLIREKEELKKKMEDLDSELKNQKEINSKGLERQSKETKSLIKQKEKLTKKNKELADEIQRLNQQLSYAEHQQLNKQQLNSGNGGYSGIRSGPPKRASSKKLSNKKKNQGYNAMDIYDKLEKEEEKEKSGDKLSILAKFCMSKKIDIKQHLRSYDTSKNGRLDDDTFMKAIIELKTSFTENDIKELIKICKPKDGGDIIIEEFIELLKKKDYDYKSKQDTIITNDNKEVARQFDIGDNPYNINYP